MKKMIVSWRTKMDSEQNPLLEEGLLDLGLPAIAVEQINSMFHDTPEKGKTVVGNLLKYANIFMEIARFNGNSRSAYEDNLRRAPDNLLSRLFRLVDLNRVSKLPDEEQQKISDELAQIVATARNMLGVSGDDQVYQDTMNLKKIDKFKKWIKKSAAPGGYFSKLAANKEVDSNWVTQEIFDEIDSALEVVMEQFGFTYNQALAPFLNMHPDNYKKIDAGKTLTSASEFASEELEKIEVEDQIIHKFDDGSYWYDLGTTSCDIEAERMGHCGQDSRATSLYSLRKKEAKQKESKSFVTIAYNENESLITQIKGRFNEIPPEATWPHIAWFIDNFEVQTVEETGEEAGDIEGFGEMLDYLKDNTTSGTDFGGFEKKIEDLTNELTEIKELFDRRMQHSYTQFDVEDPYEMDGRISYTYWGYLGIPISKTVLSKEQENQISATTAQSITEEMAEYFNFLNSEQDLTIKDDDTAFIFYFPFNASEGYEETPYGFAEDPYDYEVFCRSLEEQDDNVQAIGAILMKVLADHEIIEGGRFHQVVMNFENGEYDNTHPEGFKISYDEDYDTGLPESLNFEFGEVKDVELDLSSLKGKIPDYFLEPENVMKILDSRDYKILVRSQLIQEAGMEIGEVALPNSYFFGSKQKSPYVYTIEAGYQINADDGDEVAETVHNILDQGWDAEDLGDIALTAYTTLVNQLNKKDMEKQQSLDLNESILNKWKLMIK